MGNQSLMIVLNLKREKKKKKRFLLESITKNDLKSNDFHVIIVKKVHKSMRNQCLKIVSNLKREKKKKKRFLLESITEK